MKTISTQRVIPLLDLKVQYQTIKEEIDEAIARVLSSGRFVLGPEVEALEQEVAAFCGSRHAIGVASGTDALLLSLRALGVGPGDVVITTPFTFGATAATICNLGATPYFVDIDPKTFNLDADLLSAELENNGQLRQTTKAIIPVHLYGQMADMDPIMDIAKAFNLVVIEDAAQAIGATYKGRNAGTMGHTGCFSFFPSKNLGAYGDGGMIVTDDDALAENLRLLRVQGAKPKYIHQLVGYNSRLDALQATILRVKLKHLEGWSQSRREKAAQYDQLLKGVRQITTPFVSDYASHIYHQYTIRVHDGRRDALADQLKEQGIGTAVYYPVPLHQQACFVREASLHNPLPHAERASQEVLSLPIYPELGESEIQAVAETITAVSANIVV